MGKAVEAFECEAEEILLGAIKDSEDGRIIVRVSYGYVLNLWDYDGLSLFCRLCDDD